MLMLLLAFVLLHVLDQHLDKILLLHVWVLVLLDMLIVIYVRLYVLLENMARIKFVLLLVRSVAILLPT